MTETLGDVDVEQGVIRVRRGVVGTADGFKVGTTQERGRYA
jgi:hypothetical protein